MKAAPQPLHRLRVGHISLNGYCLHPTGTTNEAARLSRCVGPPEESAPHHCDMEAYLAPLSDYKNPVVFPPDQGAHDLTPVAPI